jgi:hypothetical protein
MGGWFTAATAADFFARCPPNQLDRRYRNHQPMPMIQESEKDNQSKPASPMTSVIIGSASFHSVFVSPPPKREAIISPIALALSFAAGNPK